ncbi:MAG: peptidylprolyl isomerase [Henriciella sp.]|jgi:peptidyl-prolyl cis-trans isomerase SurA|uniref:peptidylprolyl isomerase n=1 Tax=Henriciella sp. TaxID=1968823 RepID=UPI000C121B29|nr:SurA N-terminal domain-containing protein [Henriciella sp.]MAN73101.1 peptidylprolyl isomerase [Henriciella sp.]MBF35374.1 peptidylprolyl isomerase [Hyphomonadaceae bacterium]PHR79330.1 MAG: peptidylprolyl isomerase [Henriciella sp.]|tara:strand:- start:2753 stop:3997 length:1245 start_codon:yes stop_codon:yes gene_type:complete
MMKVLLASAMVAISAGPAVLHAEAQENTQTIEGIVAIVNDQPISYSDVRERASLLLLTLGAQNPSQQQIQQVTSQALDELIDEKLQLQEAQEYEVEVSETDINNAIADMANQSGMDREGLVNVLLSSGVNPSSLEAQMRAEIAWRRIMGGLYGSRIRISPNQIDEALEQRRAALTKVQYNLDELFLYAPSEEEKSQALQGAQTIMEQLDAGAPFSLAAQRLSSAPTAASGGDMGWVSLDDIDPEVAETVRNMSSPGVSDPIVVNDGIYLINYKAKRDPDDLETRVDLVRLAVLDGSEDALREAASEANSCEAAIEVAADNDNLDATEIEDIRMEDLGQEGQNMINEVEIGQPTQVFALSGRLAVMYVCDRRQSGAALPTREEMEDRLFARELSMISDRSLRNLRREATIIQRGS